MTFPVDEKCFFSPYLSIKVDEEWLLQAIQDSHIDHSRKIAAGRCRNLRESPIFDGKNSWLPGLDLPFNQSIAVSYCIHCVLILSCSSLLLAMIHHYPSVLLANIHYYLFTVIHHLFAIMHFIAITHHLSSLLLASIHHYSSIISHVLQFFMAAIYHYTLFFMAINH